MYKGDSLKCKMEVVYEKENTETKEGQTLKIYRASNFAGHKKVSKTNLV